MRHLFREFLSNFFAKEIEMENKQQGSLAGFLVPSIIGIALTVLGIKVSIILFVIARMIADKVGELVGKYIFNGGLKLFNVAKTIRESQVVKVIGDYLKEWLNQATNKK